MLDHAHATDDARDGGKPSILLLDPVTVTSKGLGDLIKSESPYPSTAVSHGVPTNKEKTPSQARTQNEDQAALLKYQKVRSAHSNALKHAHECLGCRRLAHAWAI
jgi:hypothetical protein